ncbi:MAG: hypothetical protein ABR598_03335, partial [Candidatus Dormibacteria bacterium]
MGSQTGVGAVTSGPCPERASLASGQSPQELALSGIQVWLSRLDQLGVSGLGPVELADHLRGLRGSINHLELLSAH